MSIRSLRTKIILVFGTFTILSVILSNYISYQQTYNQFAKEYKDSLQSVGQLLNRLLNPNKIDALRSQKDPYYPELKILLKKLTQNLNLSWLAIYRYNGRFFTHIADGADMGNEFCLDFPILDVDDAMQAAWASGTPHFADSYIDSFGTWMTAFVPITQSDGPDKGKVIAIIDASKNVEQLTRLKDETMYRVGTLIIGIALLSLFVCSLFAHSLALPLITLTEGVKLVASGHLKTRIPERGGQDEVGILIQTFNSMSSELAKSKEALEKKVFELTILFEISQKINFANNTQEILKLILEKTVEVIKAERGSIMLYDEEQEVLTIDVVFGQAIKRVEKRVEIKPGEGVAGKVFSENKPLVLNEVTESIFKPYEMDIESVVRNIMCIPLLLEKKAIGCINIVNKLEGSFAESDLELACTLGSQIALTIEKSRLYELSITDGLTKLFVHRYFQLALENELKRSRRYSKALSLILFDIDHFKKFNDTYGHQMGDRVLYYSSQLLREAIRSIDVPARYGGEEFTVILPETDLNAAFEVAERIRKRIEAFEFPGAEKPVRVTISLGVSSFPLHADERLDLIKKADEALYKSKESGRNCTTIYTPKAKA